MRRAFSGRGIAATVVALAAVVAFAAIGDAATNDTAPSTTTPPAISGTPQVGQTLTASSGSWNGTTPIAFAYQWRRCDANGGACADVASATGQTYTVQTADVDHTLRVQVTATNSGGSAQATSDPTATVTAAQSGSAPANTTAPQITGTPTSGQTLSVSTGSWTGTTPITYAYEWQRCDGNGVNCAPIAGATQATYILTGADVGGKIQVLVTATNNAGSARKYSNQVGPVVAPGPTLPDGAIKLPNGKYSVPADQVALPNRLIVDAIQYPEGGHSTQPFTVRYHVVDTRGYVIRGALVYTIGLPYGWIRPVAEAETGQDGWASFTLVPTTHAPRTGFLVQFVRARTPQGDLLAGASTRRLVQVRLQP